LPKTQTLHFNLPESLGQEILRQPKTFVKSELRSDSKLFTSLVNCPFATKKTSETVDLAQGLSGAAMAAGGDGKT
jgi:hypothetical protein